MLFGGRCYSTFEQLGLTHRKNRNAPNFPYLSLHPSQTILMVSRLVLVSKVWDGQETDKSLIIRGYPSNLKTMPKDAKKIQNETIGHPATEAHYAKFTSCVIGKSLFTLFASLTSAFHYLMTLIK